MAKYMVESGDVLAFLGQSIPQAAVDAHVSQVGSMVQEYTRGQGFDEKGVPVEGIRQVIISATARSVANPSHVVNQRAGTQSWTPGQFQGFTLPELKVLNRYRKLAG